MISYLDLHIHIYHVMCGIIGIASKLVSYSYVAIATYIAMYVAMYVAIATYIAM